MNRTEKFIRHEEMRETFNVMCNEKVYVSIRFIHVHEFVKLSEHLLCEHNLCIYQSSKNYTFIS